MELDVRDVFCHVYLIMIFCSVTIFSNHVCSIGSKDFTFIAKSVGDHTMRVLAASIFLFILASTAFAESLNIKLHCKGSYVTRDPFGSISSSLVDEILSLEGDKFSFSGTPHPQYGNVALVSRSTFTADDNVVSLDAGKGRIVKVDRNTGQLNLGNYFGRTATLLSSNIVCQKAKKSF
jgi:hypothetical protein